MGNKIDLTGQRFGRLVVVRENGKMYGRPAWLCRCDCGNKVAVGGSNLRKKRTTSCGCLYDELDRSLLNILRESKNKNNTSGVTGVSFHNSSNTWRAALRLNGELILDKYFENKQDAIDARKEAVEKYVKPMFENAEKK